MGRFNVATWSPQSDSSPKVDYDAVGVSAETNVVLVFPTPRSCRCGCGETPATKTSLFAMGHDAKLRGKLIRAHLTGTPVVLVDPDGKATTETAMSMSSPHGWQGYLNSAEQKQGPTIRAKLEATNRRILTAAVGPQPGERRLVRVGRWSYTGEILAVFEDGGTYEVEYASKKGDLVRKTVPADKVGTLVTEEA